MEKEQRNRLQKATQDARRLLEEEFAGQLLQTYDINVASGRCNEEPGAHLQAEQRLIREKLVAWIEHRSAQINDEKEALLLTLREMAFTALNRFVALKLMEARELVRPCVSGGLESEGFQEFTAVAQGLLADQEGAYRLYLETIFEDVSRELRALFDPRDPASLLWPKRTALLELLDILNRPELAELWREDETLGWIYQYFNGDAERKKMREESSAPRNSRELAVRNQFFTPRYVVEFLTDNTLGCIWYEMQQGDSELKECCRYLVRRPNEIWLQPGEEAPAEVVADEALSQEELLRQPVHIPNRALKDPREIRMLDPACGSMHFGLYAFDLYLAIYEEAWEIAQGSDEQAKQGEVFAPFVTYAADFASKVAFLREVPRLILQHNIHGVDIDPRATQIARLTLWLRAQRAWQEQGVEVAARPAISRSNVVCAEPMPGERELLADFVDQQFPEAERGLVQQLLEAIFDKMQLAGEAGSLLKVEEEIRDAIEQGRREWQKLAIQQRDLFSTAELAALGGVGSALNTDLQNLTKDFWVDIEERIYTALSSYSEQAERGGGFQRRLFAEDAAQGFAFIDVCRKCYDVALMNPPFGEASKYAKDYIFNDYNLSKYDLAAAFSQRAGSLLAPKGVIGALANRSIFYGQMLESWRRFQFASDGTLQVFGDLGLGVLDAAMVEAVAYTFTTEKTQHPTLFFKATFGERDLLECTCPLASGRLPSEVRLISVSSFEVIPAFPFAYWTPAELFAAYLRFNSLESHGLVVRQGMESSDNFRFVRLWWEVPAQEKKWKPYSKGGSFGPLWRDIDVVVNWGENGEEVKEFSSSIYGSWTKQITNSDLYGMPALCYPASRVEFSPRILPEGSIVGCKGPIIAFKKPEKATPSSYLALLSIISSSAFRALVNLTITSGDTTMRHSYRERAVSAIPIPPLESVCSDTVEMTRSAINSIRDLESSLETCRYFVQVQMHEWRFSLASKIRDQRKMVDSLICDLYGFSGPEYVAFQKTGYDDLIESASPSPGDMPAYALGILFGRWDIRYATRERSVPELDSPFSLVPSFPPGMLQDECGLQFSPQTETQPQAEKYYPIRVAWGGIIVDDPKHLYDLASRIEEVFNVIWRDSSVSMKEAMYNLLCIQTMREWFQNPNHCFADHLKRYSKSRRQAPIYWQLSAGNGSYSAWLYYHRFTQDTLYRVLRDFVEPRIQEAEREQFEFESQGGLSGDAASLLHEVQALLQDLRLFKSELELVAPLWNPNLNDGVIINHAILWRITPYTPWQKKCKECWDKLVKGDYDWAHLAFHLWPERVIRKCTTDRSLAIAHGLEERLWQETNKGNWLQRQVSEAELQALIAEHSKPAVQNALERFLAAPPPVSAARTRAPRAAKSSSTCTTRRP
ncbi:MAG: BREX-1 system adenine-specific DNA-methyltransferase PglX, partial [Cyanobacteriota bacterium]